MSEDEIIKKTQEKMEKTIETLEKRFATVRAGRANPSSLDGVMVSYYGAMTPLKQLVTISVPEATQLLLKPFDKSCLQEVEKAILSSNLGYNPSNDGETIRIVVPSLTEERRHELTKQVKSIAEEAKVAIRTIRQDANKEIEREEYAEDLEKSLCKEVQDLVNDYNGKIDAKLKEKEQELLTV